MLSNSLSFYLTFDMNNLSFNRDKKDISFHIGLYLLIFVCEKLQIARGVIDIMSQYNKIALQYLSWIRASLASL